MKIGGALWPGSGSFYSRVLTAVLTADAAAALGSPRPRDSTRTTSHFAHQNRKSSGAVLQREIDSEAAAHVDKHRHQLLQREQERGREDTHQDALVEDQDSKKLNEQSPSAYVVAISSINATDPSTTDILSSKAAPTTTPVLDAQTPAIDALMVPRSSASAISSSTVQTADVNVCPASGDGVDGATFWSELGEGTPFFLARTHVPDPQQVTHLYQVGSVESYCMQRKGDNSVMDGVMEIRVAHASVIATSWPPCKAADENVHGRIPAVAEDELRRQIDTDEGGTCPGGAGGDNTNENVVASANTRDCPPCTPDENGNDPSPSDDCTDGKWCYSKQWLTAEGWEGTAKDECVHGDQSGTALWDNSLGFCFPAPGTPSSSSCDSFYARAQLKINSVNTENYNYEGPDIGDPASYTFEVGELYFPAASGHGESLTSSELNALSVQTGAQLNKARKCRTSNGSSGATYMGLDGMHLQGNRGVNTQWHSYQFASQELFHAAQNASRLSVPGQHAVNPFLGLLSGSSLDFDADKCMAEVIYRFRGHHNLTVDQVVGHAENAATSGQNHQVPPWNEFFDGEENMKFGMEFSYLIDNHDMNFTDNHNASAEPPEAALRFIESIEAYYGYDGTVLLDANEKWYRAAYGLPPRVQSAACPEISSDLNETRMEIFRFAVDMFCSDDVDQTITTQVVLRRTLGYEPGDAYALGGLDNPLQQRVALVPGQRVTFVEPGTPAVVRWTGNQGDGNVRVFSEPIFYLGLSHSQYPASCGDLLWDPIFKVPPSIAGYTLWHSTSSSGRDDDVNQHTTTSTSATASTGSTSSTTEANTTEEESESETTEEPSTDLVIAGVVVGIVVIVGVGGGAAVAAGGGAEAAGGDAPAEEANEEEAGGGEDNAGEQGGGNEGGGGDEGGGKGNEGGGNEGGGNEGAPGNEGGSNEGGSNEGGGT